MSKNKHRQQPIPARKLPAVPPGEPATMQVSLGYDPKGPMELRDVVATKEAWSEYTLDDGITIRVKAVILDVKKAVGQYSADNNPIYVMQYAFVNQLKDVPNQMKKKG